MSREDVAKRIGDAVVDFAKRGGRPLDKRTAAVEIAKCYIASYQRDASPTSDPPMPNAYDVSSSAIQIVEDIWEKMSPDILTQIAEAIDED